MAQRAIIYNDFHNSEARVMTGRLSNATVNRVRRALCGVAGCHCGQGALKQRGPQAIEITEHHDGTVTVIAKTTQAHNA